MTQYIPAAPTSKKISDLVDLIKRERLILQPEFQRNLVWTAKHKEAFIDTILKGLPFPEIYIAQKGVDLDTLETQEVVVDGQQRLSSICEYIQDSNFCKNIKKYSELSYDEKIAFLNYDVTIRDLKDASPEIIKDIFRRINQTKYNLSPIEIQHAIYDGEFISTGYNILDRLGFQKLIIFNESEISRMSDLNFILLLMATHEEGGYYTGNTKTEQYIITFNDEYPNKDIIATKLDAIFNTIADLQLNEYSIWYRKSNFFTLVIELLKIENTPDSLKEKLNRFEEEVLHNKDNTDTDFGKYYARMFTGTNSRAARVERGEIFRKHLLQ